MKVILERRSTLFVLLGSGLVFVALDNYSGWLTRENSRKQRELIIQELRVATSEREELKGMLEEVLRRLPPETR